MWSTFHRAKTTALWRFVDALNGEINSLKKRFIPASDTALIEASTNLFSEYCTLVGNKQTDALVEKQKDQLRIYLQITQLTYYLQLNWYGYDTISQIEALTGAVTIKEAEGVLKQWTIEKQIIDKETDSLRTSNPNDGGSQKHDITGLIVEVSKYLGYPINQKSTTVKEFAGMVNSFNNYAAYIKNKTSER